MLGGQGTGRFACQGCGKTYRWKAELSGRKVKCGCGAVMVCPHSEPGVEEDLYELATDAEGPAQPARKTVAPTATAIIGSAHVAPAVVHPTPAAPSRLPAGVAPLAYRRPRDEVSKV